MSDSPYVYDESDELASIAGIGTMYRVRYARHASRPADGKLVYVVTVSSGPVTRVLLATDDVTVDSWRKVMQLVTESVAAELIAEQS